MYRGLRSGRWGLGAECATRAFASAPRFCPCVSASPGLGRYPALPPHPSAPVPFLHPTHPLPAGVGGLGLRPADVTWALRAWAAWGRPGCSAPAPGRAPPAGPFSGEAGGVCRCVASPGCCPRRQCWPGSSAAHGMKVAAAGNGVWALAGSPAPAGGVGGGHLLQPCPRAPPCLGPVTGALHSLSLPVPSICCCCPLGAEPEPPGGALHCLARDCELCTQTNKCLALSACVCVSVPPPALGTQRLCLGLSVWLQSCEGPQGSGHRGLGLVDVTVICAPWGGTDTGRGRGGWCHQALSMLGRGAAPP